ncbi:putative ribosome-binding factor A [Roseibium sp. TrichSKD4]|uniref:hypothetical protein n=1 Tax=Roseibium sp. TrichSKD4 TaxID=744980 RepID=UPI0001E56AFA|nr:hypothetical protein [Roseibium sp. TrichSKD4]EFO32578.1 putative ribosome-binding factor A [Roseibium sp. TrichSKD4]
MTKEELEIGLSQGRTLIQEEWADSAEISAVDELISEGKATATPWEYQGNYQCEMRRIFGDPRNQSERFQGDE